MIRGRRLTQSPDGSTLARKLHLKPGMRVAVVNAPARVSLGAPGVAVETSLTRDLDLVLVFATTQHQLKRQWPKALKAVKRGGALWIAYPKKSAGIPTDLGMGAWEAARGSDWNPVTTIGVNDAWSAARFKYTLGLDAARRARQTEAIRDADGMVVVDRAARVVIAPHDLQKQLAKNPKARATFDGLSFTNRKEYVVWIVEAKKPETRAARLKKAVGLLATGKKNPSGR